MKRFGYFSLAAAGMLCGAIAVSQADQQAGKDSHQAHEHSDGHGAGASNTRELYMQWEVHDGERPLPPVVDSGFPGTQERTGQAPSDAIVLFDGSSTDAFVGRNGGEIGWIIDDDGNLVVQRRTGQITTKQSFGDIQLHVEWMVPADQGERTGQNRGNSGIFLMQRYEVQVLDNKDNNTYADGMAGSIYGQAPPMVNPGRGLGQWQTYDIIFRRPRFDDDGNLVRPAYLTVLHNGIVVQDNTEVLGPTRHRARTEYQAHADALPINIQDHGEPTHYRNIWIRELPPRENPRPYETEAE